jgi:tryptophanyl-tRNA synthetase
LSKKRILSGMRPTGRLHLGNLHGALTNWIELQNDDCRECFYFVADWHALTTDYANTGGLKSNARDMLVDWLACGLDPEKSVLFVQSAVKEHAELFVLLAMITPISWLERNPTYKEMEQELVNRELGTFGFLGYPVLQAADIIIYRANGVPVGVDQLPHVELTREITRRFNYLYGEVFPVPEALLTEVPKLLGIDGRKMSKSLDNSIYLADRGRELELKVAAMFTDPQRQRRKDPGRPEVCNVFAFQKLYAPSETVRDLEGLCRTAGIGCTDCKMDLARRLAEALKPIQEREDYYLANGHLIEEIIAAGNDKATRVARETMTAVRDAIGI